MKKITITITASSTSLVFQGLREYDYNHHNFIVRPHVFSKLQYVDCGGRQDSDGASSSSSCKEAPTQLKIHVQTHVHCTLYKHTLFKMKTGNARSKSQLNLVHLEHPALHWGRFKSLQPGVDVDKSWALFLADNAPLFQFQNWIQNIIGTGIASLAGFFIWQVWSVEMFGL